MTKQEERTLQKTFIRQFLWHAYANMEMENEVHEPFDEKKLYKRYKITLDALIAEGVYKKIKMPHGG